jgi:hypothetical protein
LRNAGWSATSGALPELAAALAQLRIGAMMSDCI